MRNKMYIDKQKSIMINKNDATATADVVGGQNV